MRAHPFRDSLWHVSTLKDPANVIGLRSEHQDLVVEEDGPRDAHHANRLVLPIGGLPRALADNDALRRDFERAPVARWLPARLGCDAIRAREHAEEIAFLRADAREARSATARHAAVIEILRRTANLRALLVSYAAVAESLAHLMPTLLIAPRYFAGEITVGDVTEANIAFGQVRSGLGVLAAKMATVVRVNVAAERVLGLRRAAALAQSATRAEKIVLRESSAVALVLADLAILELLGDNLKRSGSVMSLRNRSRYLPRSQQKRTSAPALLPLSLSMTASASMLLSTPGRD